MATTKTIERRRVVGYLRVSTEQQADRGVSLDAQAAKVRGYAELYDLDLVDVIVDAGVSAKTLERPGLDRALKKLDAGEADGLLVCKLDRLTRSVRDLGILVDSYFGNGRFDLLSVAEAVDTRTAGGRLVLNVLASVTQWEREAIAERTRDALGHLRSEGVVLGGEALGWTRTADLDADGRRIVVEVQAEAEAIERMVELRQSGMTLWAIADQLTAEGRQTKRGGRWHAATVKRALGRREAV
jgi:DNA invertase Pin-like site-specific DNA recombinase